jgi:hypothetical protein
MPGLGGKLPEKLISAGLETAQEILDAGEEELLAIAGIGPRTVDRILAVAEACQQEVERLEAERSMAEAAERARVAAWETLAGKDTVDEEEVAEGETEETEETPGQDEDEGEGEAASEEEAPTPLEAPGS